MEDRNQNIANILVAPWGEPGTPLLPSSLRLLWSDESLPEFVEKACGLPKGSTIQSLERRNPVVVDSSINSTTLRRDYGNIPTAKLALSVRASSCLKKADIKSVGELVQRTESELLRFKNFGRKSLAEIKDVLGSMGLRLGMEGEKHDYVSVLGQTSDSQLGPVESARSENFAVNLVAARQEEIRNVKVFPRPWHPSVSIEVLPWRPRTRNCLHKAGLLSFNTRTLSELTYGELLQIPGMGVRSMLDFACVAEAATVRAAEMEEAMYSSRSRELLKEAHSKLKVLLDESWATEVSGEDGRFEDILPSWAGTVYDQIEQITGEHESLSRALKLAESADALIDRVNELSKLPLEDALEGFLSKSCVFDEVRTKALISRFGFGGKPPVTLEEAGSLMGVTRERVRQIESKLLERLPAYPVFMPQLDAAMDLIGGNASREISEIANMLVRAGISRQPFDPRALLSAALICRRDASFQIHQIRGTLYAVANDRTVPRSIVSFAFRQAGASGMSNVGEVLAQAASTNLIHDESEVRSILTTIPSIEFLHEDWFWHPKGKVNRNRLRNVARKMLSVVSPIDVTQVREGVRRVYRWRDSTGRFGAWPLLVPPRAALLRFFQAHPEFAVSDNGQVSSVRELDFREELGETEAALVEILRSSPTCILDRASLRDACIKRGMVTTTMDIYLTYSAIIAHLGAEIWSLRGVRVDPEAVEAVRTANAERPREKRVLDHGWTEQGGLWVAARIPKGIGNFVLSIPTEVSHMLRGRDFLARDSDGTDFGRIRFSGSTSYGYANFLKRRGADEDDVLIVEFDLVRDTALLRLEDEYFLEQLSPSM